MRLNPRLAFVIVAIFSGAAAEEPTPRYSLTIYSETPNSGLPSPFDNVDPDSGKPGGYAVVRDRRTFDLKAGNNTVQVRDVARWLDTEALSAHAVGDHEGTEIVSQRFEDATLSLDALVQKQIGHSVEVTTSGGAGQTTVTGTLLSNVGGLSVQGADGRVTTVTEFSRVTFPDLPKGLSTVPSLRWDIASKKAGAQNFEIVYPTTGLAWRANYSGWLASGGDCRVDLSGWAQIANRSGADFHGARVKLIAGEPNRVNNAPAPRAMVMKASAPRAVTAEDSGMAGDYHEYTVDALADIINGTLLRVALFAPQTIPCQRSYVFEATKLRINSGMAPVTDRSYGANESSPIVSTLAFKTDRALPAGRLRVLENASDGSPEFVGEDNLDHTPRGETVVVQLGNAFDLRGERKQTDFQIDKDKRTVTETFAIHLVNAGAAPQDVVVREHLYRWSQWSIPASSVKYEKHNADTIDFKVDVPAKGNANLTYTVQYQWTESYK